MDVFEARRKAHTGTGRRVVPRGFGSFSRELPAEKIGAQSAHRGDHPDPRGGGAAFSRLENGQARGKFSPGERLKAAVN